MPPSTATLLWEPRSATLDHARQVLSTLCRACQKSRTPKKPSLLRCNWLLAQALLCARSAQLSCARCARSLLSPKQRGALSSRMVQSTLLGQSHCASKMPLPLSAWQETIKRMATKTRTRLLGLWWSASHEALKRVSLPLRVSWRHQRSAWPKALLRALPASACVCLFLFVSRGHLSASRQSRQKVDIISYLAFGLSRSDPEIMTGLSPLLKDDTEVICGKLLLNAGCPSVP